MGNDSGEEPRKTECRRKMKAGEFVLIGDGLTLAVEHVGVASVRLGTATGVSSRWKIGEGPKFPNGVEVLVENIGATNVKLKIAAPAEIRVGLPRRVET